MTVGLTQAEADALLAMEKHRVDDQPHSLPGTGGGLVVPLISHDGAEAFHLDISRGRINLQKGKIQNRARSTIVLARIGFGGAPHRNPDDEEIPSPPIHLYREGYGDRWAFSIMPEVFTDMEDHWRTLEDFLRFCNVTCPPNFDRGLFT